MHIVSFTEARKNFKSILDSVAEDHIETVITRRDATDVVVMSLDDYNSWKETNYLLSTPANTRHLMESIEQHKSGRSIKHELIDE